MLIFETEYDNAENKVTNQDDKYFIQKLHVFFNEEKKKMCVILEECDYTFIDAENDKRKYGKTRSIEFNIKRMPCIELGKMLLHYAESKEGDY